MASQQGIRAGRAFVELFANDEKLKAGLARAEADIKRFGATVAGMGRQMAMLGAGMLAPVIGAVKLFASAGDDLDKMSRRTGVGVESLQGLGHAAKQSGADVTTLETGIRRMSRVIYDAGRGSAEAVDALAKLGLSVESLSGLSPEEQFKTLSDALSRVSDATQRAALAQLIFGRSGTQLLPMIENGRAGIEALEAEFHSLGITISTADSKAAAKFTDTLSILWQQARGGIQLIGAALTPTLQQFADKVSLTLRGLSEWITNNRQLIASLGSKVLALAAASVTIGAVAIAVGKLIQAIGGLIGVVRKLLTISITPLNFTLASLGLALAATVSLAVMVARSFSAMSAAAAHNRRVQEQALQTMKQSHAEDAKKIQRLRELEQAGKLTAGQQVEAKSIVADLEKTYGKLNVVIDGQTGALRGVGEAWKHVEKQQKAAMAAANSRMLAQYKNEIIKLQEEMESLKDWGKAGLYRSLLGRGHEQIGRELEVAIKRLGEFHAQLRAQEAGGVSIGIGTALVDPAETENWLRKLHQLELQQIEDSHEQRKALIDERYNHEIDKLDKAYYAQKDQTAAAIKDGAERQRILTAQYDEYAAHVRTIHKAHQAELAIEEKRQADEVAREKQRADERRQAELARIEELNADQVYKNRQLELELQHQGLDLQRELLKLEEERRIEAAKTAGLNVEAVQKELDLRRQIMDAAAEAAVQLDDTIDRITVRGTFSAAAIGGMALGGDAVKDLLQLVLEVGVIDLLQMRGDRSHQRIGYLRATHELRLQCLVAQKDQRLRNIQLVDQLLRERLQRRRVGNGAGTSRFRIDLFPIERLEQLIELRYPLSCDLPCDR